MNRERAGVAAITRADQRAPELDRARGPSGDGVAQHASRGIEASRVFDRTAEHPHRDTRRGRARVERGQLDAPPTLRQDQRTRRVGVQKPDRHHRTTGCGGHGSEECVGGGRQRIAHERPRRGRRDQRHAHRDFGTYGRGRARRLGVVALADLEQLGEHVGADLLSDLFGDGLPRLGTAGHLVAQRGNAELRLDASRRHAGPTQVVDRRQRAHSPGRVPGPGAHPGAAEIVAHVAHRTDADGLDRGAAHADARAVIGAVRHDAAERSDHRPNDADLLAFVAHGPRASYVMAGRGLPPIGRGRLRAWQGSG